MIRNRIKKRIEKRRNKGNKNDESDDGFDKIDQSMIDEEENNNDNDNDNNDNKPKQSQTNSNTDENNNDNFNYLTDICKDKKFNKKELGLILRVIKLELQPLIYLFLFIKGVLLWKNTAFTIFIMILLLYFAYINIVKYLFSLFLFLISLLMFTMKTNPEKLIFFLAILVGLVADIDDDQDDDIKNNKNKNKNNNDKPKQKELKKWQLIQRAKRVKKNIQKKFIQLGEFQFMLYQLSIYIGKIRAIYFYKDDKLGKILCILYAVFGLLFIILPLRINYALGVLLLFTAKPLILFIRKKRGPKKKGQFAKKVKAALNNVEPDIPKVEFNENNQQ